MIHSNSHIQNLNGRIRLTSLFFQNLKYADDGFADVVLELIYRFALGIATGEGGNLSPKAAFRIFMDDNGVVLHASIFLQKAVSSTAGYAFQLIRPQLNLETQQCRAKSLSLGIGAQRHRAATAQSAMQKKIQRT